MRLFRTRKSHIIRNSPRWLQERCRTNLREANPTKTELEYKSFVISGIYLNDNINEVIDFFNVANAELDKLTASDKAA
ncbi:hypothetical protein AB6D04_02085 [Vibrio splendidus]|uniref:hypothetical protein n=1 Tax=Vibrio splendidus TaxID=29497 RepID=UPI000CAB4109|nr:hypothetical protein [Vibrio splendidus]PMN82829.1 hypothetical protein BCT24_12120 [Vibrio splendidus]